MRPFPRGIDVRSRANWAALLAFATLTACGGNTGSLASNALPQTEPSTADAPAALESVLHSFKGPPDGQTPYAGLAFGAAGSLLGTTVLGGLPQPGCSSDGCGVVFKLTPAAHGYHETIVRRFRGPSVGDGDAPAAPVIEGPDGTVYGTTYAGGKRTLLAGTVFALRPSTHGYSESVIYRFPNFPYDGATPYGGLAIDAAGTLYGTTSYGGRYNEGTVFALQPRAHGYSESVLHSFNFHDGAFPASQLSIGLDGTLYGTASGGGDRCGSSGGGCGVIFSLTKRSSTYVYAVIYHLHGKTDGSLPAPGLQLAGKGTLYGSTVFQGPGGCGTVFRLTPNVRQYTMSVLHSFTCSKAGGSPEGAPVLGPGGVLYGTTTNGGNLGCSSGSCGVVYKLTPSGKTYALSTVYAFRPHNDGNRPQAGVIVDSAGNVYGTTLNGGTNGKNFGAVFQVKS